MTNVSVPMPSNAFVKMANEDFKKAEGIFERQLLKLGERLGVLNEARQIIKAINDPAHTAGFSIKFPGLATQEDIRTRQSVLQEICDLLNLWGQGAAVDVGPNRFNPHQIVLTLSSGIPYGQRADGIVRYALANDLILTPANIHSLKIRHSDPIRSPESSAPVPVPLPSSMYVPNLASLFPAQEGIGSVIPSKAGKSERPPSQEPRAPVHIQKARPAEKTEKPAPSTRKESKEKNPISFDPLLYVPPVSMQKQKPELPSSKKSAPAYSDRLEAVFVDAFSRDLSGQLSFLGVKHSVPPITPADLRDLSEAIYSGGQNGEVGFPVRRDLPAFVSYALEASDAIASYLSERWGIRAETYSRGGGNREVGLYLSAPVETKAAVSRHLGPSSS
ncbi:MAG: hypothetical protein V1728_03075 [Candidatus Micrarchaeota archaeon]